MLFCVVRYFLDISYNGSSFNGWQIQPNGKTVQEEIEKALSTVLQEKINILGSGRTDAGVHAIQQIAHFDSDTSISLEDLAYKLNSFLGKDIAINSIKSVSEKAHARFDATRRTYHYHINQKKNPFLQTSSYYYNQPIDTSAIKEACKIICDWENFECFSKVHTEVNNFNCEIFVADWQKTGDSHLFIVQANRFLRGMIRAMVGTLLEIGAGKASLTDFRKILESQDRSKAGRAVPAQGLFLQKVEYPKDIY